MITEELITSRLVAQEAGPGHDRPGDVPSTVHTPVLPPHPLRPDGDRTGAAGRTRTLSAISANRRTAQADPTLIIEPAAEPEKVEKKEGGVSATQLVAGAAAAATSSVIGGQLGVAGTVIGAGIASIITALAVALYSKSLHLGREHVVRLIKLRLFPKRAAAADRSLAMATSSSIGSRTSASAVVGGTGESEGAADSAPPTWQQKLRRKRVVYPVVIGVATFGIGLGSVVMAESFTGADISPGTSQISRTVTGNSSTERDSGDSSGSKSSRHGERSGSGTSENGGTGTETSADSTTTGTTVNNPGSTDGSGADATGTTNGSDTAGANGADSSSAATGSGASSSGSGGSGSNSSGGAAVPGTDSGSANSGGSGTSSAAGSSSASGGSSTTSGGSAAGGTSSAN